MHVVSKDCQCISEGRFWGAEALLLFESPDEESDPDNPGRWCQFCDTRMPEAEMSSEAAF